MIINHNEDERMKYELFFTKIYLSLYFSPKGRNWDKCGKETDIGRRRETEDCFIDQ